MSPRPLEIFYSFSARVDFRRQNHIDVKFWRLKSIPALKEFSAKLIYIYIFSLTWLVSRYRNPQLQVVKITHNYLLNPLTAGAVHICFLHFLLTHCISAFKHVKNKNWHYSARFEICGPPFCQIWIIFTHLKLWIASARHNLKWVKIPIE